VQATLLTRPADHREADAKGERGEDLGEIAPGRATERDSVPYVSVKARPQAIFPNVAWLVELSMNA
jgi:hypothetical protein